jgi:UDP-galactopyranose mutase
VSRADILVVGAGFSGAVVAQRLAQRGFRVVIIDQRPHIGGNAYDRLDRDGVLVHPYGPHIFHTNSERIYEYLSRFTEWRFYEHRVLAHVQGKFVPIPINIDTVNRLYDLQLDESSIQAFFDSVREPRADIRTSEDVVLNAVGRDLYEKFFRWYTHKQWGLDPSELSASVAARIPTRTNRDDRYFTDRFQFMPLHGYTRLFERLLDSPRIRIETGCNFFGFKMKARHVVYTGPIDAFFGHCYGRLPYRSIDFEHEHLSDTAQYQRVGTVNYPNDQAFTRITEFRHITGQAHSGTSIVREYPTSEGDPYYPIPKPENEALFKRYEALTLSEPNVTFVGRLANYRYYNMDQCVGAALKAADTLLERIEPERTVISLPRPKARAVPVATERQEAAKP